ncbi:MAG TPA: glycosyltransferase [Actinotalea sp.]|jgi:glycosyltransferase involved in cell wall biosynthesis
MRVVQVSAHYPPDFVSGGTLVPQRIARGLAARGHDVHVYAGHLAPTRPPLSTWDEVDEAGVQVRWITTTPWTGWADERNYDNPDVTADFAAWLAQVQPDVVHLHSVQTLGGGLVSAAKAAGAAVVVTMHDFWWMCARQFLVARDMTPCSLVVDCGACECQVDHAWLLRRNALLAEHVADADLVLAPSRSAARVLAANGVDVAKLRVDENGVPGVVPAEAADEADAARADAAEPRPVQPDVAEGEPEPAPATASLRFMFAGGADPMKGLPVLLDAVRLVRAAQPWEIDLYGAGSLPPGLPPTVRSLPPYLPTELADVLAAHDVLVLPSVMRESHSILTREALAAGLAVICTDTLGPEEAVDHGRNGLVVPAGDPHSLAAAVERFVDDRAMVRSMQAEPSRSPLRDVDDQVAGLEQLYAEVAAPVPAEALLDGPVGLAEDGLLRRVLFVVGIQGAPLRYRAHLPAEALGLLGVHTDVRHYRDPELPDLAAAADAVVLYRVPATDQVLELVAEVRRRPRAVPVVFDVDDLIFDPELEGEVHGLASLTEEEHQLWWKGVARYRTTMELADLYVGSTDALCAHAAATTGLPVRRFSNGVGEALAAVSDRALGRPRRPGPLRIGYFSGTTTHDADWALIEPAVLRAMTDHPDVELWLGGHLTPTPAIDAVADRVHRLPMLPWAALPARLRDVDVNLAPLIPGGIFNEAKSAIKWLEAALVETPTIATPTAPFREVIESGRTGILATTVEEWSAALTLLLDDEVERARIGSQARREALLTLSPHLQARVYQQILRDAAELVRGGARGRTSSWEPVSDDEPLSAADAWVDPYPGPLETSAPSSATVARVRAQAAAVRRVYRSAGARGVVAKTRTALTRRS